jgi:uncharacterized protein YxeA
MTHRESSRTNVLSTGVRLILVTVIAIGLSSCVEAAKSALGITSVNASDGTYAQQIELTWDPVSATDENGNELIIDYYEIERTEKPFGPTLPPIRSDGSGTEYTDTTVTPGVTYEYSVTGYFTDGSPKEVTLSDTGYAMNATNLKVYGSSSDGAVAYDASAADEWFNFLGQEGWTYDVVVTGSGSIALYRLGTIEVAEVPVSTGSGTAAYVLPDSEIYHVKITGGSGTVSVSHR